MEFARVGKHCSMHDCHQQDFLPFQCQFCAEVFCGDHRRPDDHKCTAGGYDAADDNFVIVCPICEGRISMKGTGASPRGNYEKDDKGELKKSPRTTADKVWQLHVDRGDCAREQQRHASQPEQTCGYGPCNEKLKTQKSVLCRKCGLTLCIKHRFDDAHECG